MDIEGRKKLKYSKHKYLKKNTVTITDVNSKCFLVLCCVT